MNINEKTKLMEALKKGSVTVTFRKINTDEIRVMPCTLNEAVLKANDVPIKVDSMTPDSDHFVAWALDKDAWRSFRLSTVEGWEVL